MRNDLNSNDRILDDQFAEFVDHILSNREVDDVQLSNLPELYPLETVALRLKRVMTERRDPDPAFLVRLRNRLMAVWKANTIADKIQRTSLSDDSVKEAPPPRRKIWSGWSRQRPLTLGLSFMGMLAALLGIAILLGPQLNPDLPATAGGIAGWLPVLLVGVGVFVLAVVAWASRRRK